MDFSLILLAFGVIFISELPDKSMVASLILGTKFPSLYVWIGISAAFLVHVLIAVTAGQVLTLLPHVLVESIVASLFLVGAALLFFGHHDIGPKDKNSQDKPEPSHGFWKVAATSFSVIFIGEWGDITQIVTANYTAQYHNPLAVAIGATLALWSVAGIAVIAGEKVLDRVPARLLQNIMVAILLIFAIVSFYSAFH